MIKRTLAFILSATLLFGLLPGCSVLDKKIKEYSKEKEKCVLDSDHVTQFTYKEEKYTILEDTAARGKLGSWVGTIRKLAVIDANGKILLAQDTDSANLKTLVDVSDDYPEAAYIIPFLNVYSDQDKTDRKLLVDANGGYHMAIPTRDVKASDVVFQYGKKQSASSDGHFTVNPKDCTQLTSEKKIYRITDETVPDGQVGEYLDVIAKSITFDQDTKLEIPKKDLDQIDWDGKGSGRQKRENWSYGEVHKIQDKDVSDSVAVEINFNYRIAVGR